MWMLLIAGAMAADTWQVEATTGLWNGAELMSGRGGGVVWQRDARMHEARFAYIEDFCIMAGCREAPDIFRGMVLTGRRWERRRGRWMASVDLAAGLGGGRGLSGDEEPVPEVGAVGQVRASAGLTWLGVNARSAMMVGNTPPSGEFSLSVYVTLP